MGLTDLWLLTFVMAECWTGFSRHLCVLCGTLLFVYIDLFHEICLRLLVLWLLLLLMFFWAFDLKLFFNPLWNITVSIFLWVDEIKLQIKIKQMANSDFSNAKLECIEWKQPAHLFTLLEQTTIASAVTSECDFYQVKFVPFASFRCQEQKKIYLYNCFSTVIFLCVFVDCAFDQIDQSHFTFGRFLSFDTDTYWTAWHSESGSGIKLKATGIFVFVRHL